MKRTHEHGCLWKLKRKQCSHITHSAQIRLVIKIFIIIIIIIMIVWSGLSISKLKSRISNFKPNSEYDPTLDPLLSSESFNFIPCVSCESGCIFSHDLSRMELCFASNGIRFGTCWWDGGWTRILSQKAARRDRDGRTESIMSGVNSINLPQWTDHIKHNNAELALWLALALLLLLLDPVLPVDWRGSASLRDI